MAEGSSIDTLQPGSLVEQVQHLSLISREIAAASLAGQHPTKRRGSSVEFAEHKEYTPGDDTKRIDWRVYARADRFYLKQHQDESNHRVYIMFDHSGSMGYGADASAATRGLEKRLYAARLAAALAQIAISQRDRVGLLTVGNGAVDLLPPRASSTHFEEVLARLIAAEARGVGDFALASQRLIESSRQGAALIVLSDMYDRSGALIDALATLAARRFDVSVMHVMHPDERDFPFEAPAFFSSMETANKVFVHPRLVREAFIKRMVEFRERTAVQLRERGVGHFVAFSDQDPGPMLAEYLVMRARLVQRGIA